MRSGANPGSSRPRRLLWGLLGLILVSLVALAVAINAGLAFPGLKPSQWLPSDKLAQPSPTPTPTKPQASRMDLQTLEGESIAQGTNTTLIKANYFSVKTYRLEVLALPRPVEVTIDEQTLEVEKAWRLTITGKFGMYAIPYAVWIDDAFAGIAEIAPDLSAISVVLYDSSLLADGATIAVSRDHYYDRVELPEKLDLPQGQ